MPKAALIRRRLAQPSLFEQTPLNGIDGTFMNAKNDPVHSWYPYLEGYSPAFVESLWSRFMPGAQRVIDPFAGSGTTPLVLAELGVECGYCEVNPAMRFVAQTKLAALSLTTARRAEISNRALSVAGSLDEIGRMAADSGIAESYARCFGTSKFFTDQTFDDALRLRTLCDSLRDEDAFLSDLVALAVIAQLVSCSLLKRAGDVRYKTESELARGVPGLPESVAGSIRQMARHLQHAPTTLASAVLLASDAKQLTGAPSFKADGVITSPPYLNGTNYIRNTKVELWFLRAISRGSDLRLLRDGVVTSGINDVTMNGPATGVTPAIEALVREIEKTAYDQRIHRMVAGYFSDMQRVLAGLWHHTVPDAVVCIDLGDSRYGGIGVPTQDLLIDVASATGFKLQERVPLRTRVSKDRSVLSQDVLVFRRANSQTQMTVRKSDLRERWRWFRETVPHQQQPYTKRNWGHSLHSACSYNGKMKPSLAHFLVHCFTEPGDLVLDPFSGAGTIPFEASLQGRRSAGFDISVMGAAVTNAKINPPEPDRLKLLLDALEKFIETGRSTEAERESAAAVRFNRPIPEYFHERTLDEILLARRFFIERRDDSAEWCSALTSMLHILHGNRPYALSRRSHPVTPFAPTGPTEYRNLMERLKDKVARNCEMPAPPEFARGRCFVADVCAPWPSECATVDAIITSPPFFDSTRFYMTNWMRYWFCGWERQDFDSEPQRFIESLQRQSLTIYRAVFERFQAHLSPGGVAVLHLGQSKKCDMGAALSKLASDFLTVEELFTEDVTHCEKHGLSDKGTVTAHQYLVLSKS